MFISKPPDPGRIKEPGRGEADDKQQRIEKLLDNRLPYAELIALRKDIEFTDLSNIIQRIYDLNEKYILEISAVEGLLRKFNNIKNDKRNAVFIKKIRNGFRDPRHKDHKVILAEGDSWFNYPVILMDIVDRISVEKNFAMYSLASGGDWLLNMLTARNYVEELSVLHPDIFMISGGGNDLAGSSRIAAIVDPKTNSEYKHCELVTMLMENAERKAVPLNSQRYLNGLKYLSKDFFALVMFFHLQYYKLINGILKADRKLAEGEVKPESKFKNIRIITQGYDFGIPALKKSFGINPALWYVPFIRKFLGHGRWLKSPLMMRGILDEQVQRDIIYAMIYIINEMMIDIGKHFNSTIEGSVSHIDSRGSIPTEGWTDELHPRPYYFMQTAKKFVECINKETAPTYGNVYVVKPAMHEKN